jgi:hypothetical protein
MKRTMKWSGRLFIALVILIFGFVGYAMLTASRAEDPVGFQVFQTTDANGHPLIVDVWYPTQAQPWPTMFQAVDL